MPVKHSTFVQISEFDWALNPWLPIEDSHILQQRNSFQYMILMRYWDCPSRMYLSIESSLKLRPNWVGQGGMELVHHTWLNSNWSQNKCCVEKRFGAEISFTSFFLKRQKNSTEKYLSPARILGPENICV